MWEYFYHILIYGKTIRLFKLPCITNIKISSIRAPNSYFITTIVSKYYTKCCIIIYTTG